eukprot:9717689-Alexandrium_andersonii.AAC.1
MGSGGKPRGPSRRGPLGPRLDVGQARSGGLARCGSYVCQVARARLPLRAPPTPLHLRGEGARLVQGQPQARRLPYQTFHARLPRGEPDEG